MDKIKRKKIELAGAHRACEFYGLNEGIDNHITTKDMIHMGFYVVWWLWWSFNSKWLISDLIPKKINHHDIPGTAHNYGDFHQNHCTWIIFHVEKDSTTIFQKFKLFGILGIKSENNQ